MCQHHWIYAGSGQVECTSCKEKQVVWRNEREKFVYVYKLFLIGADVTPYIRAA